MLTVLYRAPNGTEQYFEAETVQRYSDNSIPASGEIMALGVDYGPVRENRSLDISEPFGAVFVMNRHGATVAKYMHP